VVTLFSRAVIGSQGGKGANEVAGVLSCCQEVWEGVGEFKKYL